MGYNVKINVPKDVVLPKVVEYPSDFDVNHCIASASARQARALKFICGFHNVRHTAMKEEKKRGSVDSTWRKRNVQFSNLTVSASYFVDSPPMIVREKGYKSRLWKKQPKVKSILRRPKYSLEKKKVVTTSYIVDSPPTMADSPPMMAREEGSKSRLCNNQPQPKGILRKSKYGLQKKARTSSPTVMTLVIREMMKRQAAEAVSKQGAPPSVLPL